MRTAARVDAVQPTMIAELQQAGFSILPLYQIGSGIPDFIAARAGISIMVEAKNGPKYKRTSDQIKFHAEWRGESILIAWVTQQVLVEWTKRAKERGAL